MTIRPTVYPDFAMSDQTDPISSQPNVATPPVGKVNYGWGLQEFPPRQWFNFLHRWTATWIRWIGDDMLGDAVEWNDTLSVDTAEGFNAASTLVSVVRTGRMIMAKVNPLTVSLSGSPVFVDGYINLYSANTGYWRSRFLPATYDQHSPLISAWCGVIVGVNMAVSVPIIKKDAGGPAQPIMSIGKHSPGSAIDFKWLAADFVGDIRFPAFTAMFTHL